MERTTQKAFKLQEQGKAAVITAPVTEPAAGFVRVQVLAVALNPTDWKHITWWKGPPGINTTVGCDYSGVIDKLGPGANADLKVGDYIAGFGYGANALDTETGVFSEYANVDSHICFKIPEGMSTEEASTLGVATTTIGQALYQKLQLPLPTKPATNSLPILIYGGSTAVGNLTIQYAKLSGLTVITLASRRNHEFLLSLGADAVFDYNDTNVAKMVREYTRDKLELALDTISTEGSAAIVDECISSNGGKVVQILEVNTSKLRKDVQYSFVLAYTGKSSFTTCSYGTYVLLSSREMLIDLSSIWQRLQASGCD